MEPRPRTAISLAIVAAVLIGLPACRNGAVGPDAVSNGNGAANHVCAGSRRKDGAEERRDAERARDGSRRASPGWPQRQRGGRQGRIERETRRRRERGGGERDTRDRSQFSAGGEENRRPCRAE